MMSGTRGDPSSPEARLLIAEPEAKTADRLEQFFVERGYATMRVRSEEDALEAITALPPHDMVLLATTLSEGSGYEVLREARRVGVEVPVILLAREYRADDAVRGFTLGADDYVSQPFDVDELGARVKAVRRRVRTPTETLETYTFGDVRVNFAEQSVHRKSQSITFTTLEFEILKYFIRHRGRTVDRAHLLREIWGVSGEVTTRTVDRHVASIRRKIEPDPTDPIYIETIYGVGYKFVG